MVIVGSSRTRIIERARGRILYTPRGIPDEVAG
jgi:precorrin-3B C17-methyltransferase